MPENWLPLPVPQGRDGVTGEWAARLTRRVNALRVLFGNGFRVLSRGPDGVRVECVAVAAERAAAPLAPWTVRHHTTEDDADGQWEIYLPSGCMSVGEPLQNLNKAASETSGHDGDGEDVKPDPPAWRIFPVDENEGTPLTQKEGDATKTYREFNVVAHAKTLARLNGVDAINKPAKRYLYVSAKRALTAAELEQETEEDKAKDAWGDEFSQVVARIEVGTITKAGKTTPYRKITQIARAPISVAARPRCGFDLEWVFGFKDNGFLEVKNVYCVRQLASAAGFTLRGPEMTEVKDAQETIYAKILTNPLDPESAGQVNVLKDPSNPKRDDYNTWLRLYDISYNAVKGDYRAHSLVNIQIYR